MFDFLSYEVFQIVVITALFVIGIMLFMLYKRPSENISQYLDDIDYRIDKMNKKLDELTNTFVNGLIVDEEESDTSSINGQSNEETQEVQEVQEVQADDELNTIQNKEIKSLNYEGIEFSDIPNFSTDTSVLDEEHEEHQEPEKETNGKKRVNIIKRIIQSEE